MKRLAGLVWILALVGPIWRASAGQIVVMGQVMDPKLRPIQGAQVQVYQVPYYPWQPIVLVGDPALTDRNGRFEVKGKAQDYLYCYVVARKEGYAYAWQWRWHSQWYARGHWQCCLILQRPVKACGKVVDFQGRPVPNAKVQLIGQVQHQSYMHELSGPEQWLSTVTDPRGRFQFSQLPEGAEARFLVRADGWACTYEFWASSKAGVWFDTEDPNIVLQLPAEGAIKGKVLDEDGRPVAGVRLLLTDQGSDRQWRYVTRLTESDPCGVFSFEGVPAGRHMIETAPLPEDTPFGQGIDVALKAGQVLDDLVLRISQGFVAQINVQDNQTTRPIQGALVKVYSEEGCSRGPAFTDANGLVRVRVPQPGQYTVYAQAPGYFYDFGGYQMVIERPATQWFQVRLGPYPRLRARVVDPTGRPLQGVSSGGSISGPDGVIEDVLEDALVLRHPEQGLAAVVWSETVADQDQIVLRPAPTLTGRVEDPDGKGIGGVLVTMIRPTEVQAVTDAHGVYSIKAIPFSEEWVYLMFFDRCGYSWKSAALRPEKVSKNRIELGPVQLRPADQEIGGILLDPNGRPAAEMAVSVGGSGQPLKTVVTDKQGRFRIKGVCRGSISLQVLGEEGSLRTTVPAPPVTLVIGRDLVGDAVQPVLGKQLDLDQLCSSIARLDLADKEVLLCFLDIQQGPSRRMLVELSSRAATLSSKGITILLIQVYKIELDRYHDWLQSNNIGLPIHLYDGDFDQDSLQLGIKGLPWLMLTDKRHTVIAEGPTLSQLDQRSGI
ncbi:MAG: carboxypeptidase-like regulatory domain-containing protein [Sedimentisphaerales bacterium]|nr:carboxypeptidase-like regulatory domain-containing protein [Sedimentisphaerales bacterium]